MIAMKIADVRPGMRVRPAPDAEYLDVERVAPAGEDAVHLLLAGGVALTAERSAVADVELPERTARSVSAVLRKAGISTGYRYTQTGYRDHDNNPVKVLGCMVTRRADAARYGGRIDLGHVEVYAIDPITGHSPKEFLDRVLQVLIDAGLPATLKYGAIEVAD